MGNSCWCLILFIKETLYLWASHHWSPKTNSMTQDEEQERSTPAPAAEQMKLLKDCTPPNRIPVNLSNQSGPTTSPMTCTTEPTAAPATVTPLPFTALCAAPKGRFEFSSRHHITRYTLQSRGRHCHTKRYQWGATQAFESKSHEIIHFLNFLFNLFYK